MKTAPILLETPNDRGSPLSRIESTPGSAMDESWLQRLIFEHPEILPVQSFDESTQDVIPVARELPTPVGYIDAIFIAPNGTIVIVETKLWKNPEKHRTVVAQIIDYAKELSKWTYHELDDAVRKALPTSLRGDGKGSLLDILRTHVASSGIGFDEFQERVQRKLAEGEFLLLIIGDRISPNVAFLTDWISSAPGLNFRLGLVEIQLYPVQSGCEWPLLIVPDVVGRTVEKTRGVVKIRYEQEKPRADVEYAEKDEGTEKTTQEEFLAKVRDDLSPVYERWFGTWQSKGFVVYWGVSGFSLRVHRGTRLRTVVEAYPDWAASVIRQKDAETVGVPAGTYRKYLEAVRALPGVAPFVASGRKYVGPEAISADELDVLFSETSKLAEELQDSPEPTGS